MAWFGYQYLSAGNTREDGEGIVREEGGGTATSTLCVAHRLLDGICVTSENEINPPLVAVMVENSYEAWPLSGLSSARVVYEAPAEGDIPRFLLLYPVEEGIVKVGPVRSARPYYLDWANEYSVPLYMHVGGSPEALQRLRANEKVVNADEYFHSNWFWRSSDRRMPHNTYTNTERWQLAWEENKDVTRDLLLGWVFDEKTPCEIDCVKEITAAFLSPTYDATWKYNASTTAYTRYQNYRQQFDDDGTPILANTIIVQMVKAETIDDIGRKDIDTIGEGQAFVFRDGYITEGFWKKAIKTARTRFVDTNGNEIPLKAGKIWIEVLPTYREVTWK